MIETIDKFSSQNIGKNFIDTKTTAVSTTTNPQLLLQQLSSTFFNEMQDGTMCCPVRQVKDWKNGSPNIRWMNSMH